MPPKQPPTDEDKTIAVALIVMAASAQMLTEGADDITALAHALWPKSIHRDALTYGPGALTTMCVAFGIDAEQVSLIAQRMVAG